MNERAKGQFTSGEGAVINGQTDANRKASPKQGIIVGAPVYRQ